MQRQIESQYGISANQRPFSILDVLARMRQEAVYIVPSLIVRVRADMSIS